MKIYCHMHLFLSQETKIPFLDYFSLNFSVILAYHKTGLNIRKIFYLKIEPFAVGIILKIEEKILTPRWTFLRMTLSFFRYI